MGNTHFKTSTNRAPRKKTTGEKGEEMDLKINYIHKDVNDIKLKSSYDVIIAYEVLEHLKDWPDLIKKIKSN